MPKMEELQAYGTYKCAKIQQIRRLSTHEFCIDYYLPFIVSSFCLFCCCFFAYNQNSN